MFQVYDKDGRLMCECPVESAARDRLSGWEQAHYIQEVVEIRRLVAIKEESDEASVKEGQNPPW